MTKTNLSIYGLIFCLGLLSISSFAAIIADAVAFRAVLQERIWVSGKPITDLEEWQRAQQHTLTALKFSPGHPEYLFLLGRLGSWRFLVDDEAEDISAEIGQSYAAFKEALAKRPYWPDGWSEFAFLKSQIDEIDVEFELAVYTAISTGPYEAKPILNLLKATFSAWPSLGPDLKQETINLFGVALELPYITYTNLPAQTIDLAKGFELLDELCADEGLSEVARAKCADALRTP